ncbi:RHS repeat-associated core domain-containing protein [Photorhabdus sp. APURE]|uniref:RHS repeat-associated core domain-containing protein n=1 Tax=Photorhabdus aballayi TaxID=2991723 RepID=UPI00223D305F|nr:RHS repeat-associated core domain-containing protein [Photorhabdus aballayi]MCW7551012.1 RHS repeat-associated core domain-containing protein [Photorhabdus aballayi]
MTWIDSWGLASNPTTATHITYQGMDAATGKPYVGYASMQGQQTGTDVVKYRYNGNFERFGGKPPEVFYEGYGQVGKDTARGLEQRRFEQLGGLNGTANKRNPVGIGNTRRTEYLNAADKYLNQAIGDKLINLSSG